VTNPGDAGAGSLRGEIALAQSGDTINFAANLNGQTITPTGGELAINQNLTITGPGANRLAVSGHNASRVLDIQSGTVAISGLTVTGGNGSGGNGGGIFSIGNLTLTGDAVVGNVANGFGFVGFGGGVYNGSTGTLTVTDSTVNGNQALQGGGVYNDVGTAAITNSTIAGNTASSQGTGTGGGGLNNSGTLSLENDTIAGNVAQGLFGSNGGGIDNVATLSMSNTIVAQNTASSGPDYYGAPYTGGSNFVGGDPKLGPFQNNGGPTSTMALLAGSPALNAGTASGAPATDQRGVPRTGGVNIGAYQASATMLSVAGFPSSVTAGTAGQVVVTAEDSFGQAALGYTGAVHSTSSDAQAVLPANYTYTASDSGVHTFSAILKTAGTQALTATDTANSSITGTQGGIVVNPASTGKLAVRFPLSATVHTPASGTVNAEDAYGNLTPAYTGAVYFTSTDPRANLSPDTTLTNGSATFFATLNTVGTQSLTATDRTTGTITGTQSGIVVHAAAARVLTVSGSPSSVTAGDPAALTVTLTDAYGNVATGYTGTVHFSSSDAQAGLPADYSFTAADGGRHTFSATLKTAGLQTVTATDTGNGGLTGTFPGFTDVAAPTEDPAAITAGPDGNLWFTEADYFIAKITPAGAVTEYLIPADTAPAPHGITVGPDGNLWFTESNRAKVGKITPAGMITEYTLPLGGISTPFEITAGPDGNLWFTEFNGNKVAKITQAGAVTEYVIPTPGSFPDGITAGPDGNLWFTETATNKVGKITPAGVITEYSVPTGDGRPEGITAGPDGNLWFTELGIGKIGRVTPTGVFTDYALAGSRSSPFWITPGPDGNLWFTEFGGDRIGRITPAGAVTEYPVPNVRSIPSWIAAGPDGALWFTDPGTRKVWRYNLGVLVTPAAASVLSVNGFPTPVTAGTAGTFTVTAQDAFNNTVTGYTGTVHFSSADPFGATLPADYTFQPADQGVAFFPGGATLYTAGVWDVTATDTASGLSGSDLITVTGAPAVALQVLTHRPAGDDGVPAANP
jgi:streptogramin lyase